MSNFREQDDISVSVVVPRRALQYPGTTLTEEYSYKFVKNCEYRLFQRPDDAIHRGLDKQTEADLARSDNFIVNFERPSSFASSTTSLYRERSQNLVSVRT